MPRILSGPLKILDRIFSFPGGQIAPDSMDLSLPIQLVNDVSRQSELGSGAHWIIAARQAHSAAGTISDTIRFVDASVQGGTAAGGFRYDTRKQDMWLMGAWATCSNPTNFNGAYLETEDAGITPGVLGTAAVGVDRLVEYWDAASAVGSVLRSTRGAQASYPVPVILTNPSAVMGFVFTSVSSGVTAFNLDFNAHIWVGPRGVTPPGLS